MVLKELSNELSERFQRILNDLLKHLIRPSDWKDSNIIPIFKKGIKISG